MAIKITPFVASTYTTLENLIFIYKRNKQLFINHILKDPLYPRLSQHPIFQKISEQPAVRQHVFSLLKIQPMKFVDQDECISIKEPIALATSDVGTDLAICVRGKNKTGQTLKTLEHTSMMEHEKTTQESFDTSIMNLKLQMVEMGCLEETIDFFVLGGKFIADDPDANSLEIEKHILSVAKKYNIVGVQFNPSDELGSGFDLFFTSDKIYYCTKRFFPVPDPEIEEMDIFFPKIK
jgi:hypothetical protein